MERNKIKYLIFFIFLFPFVKGSAQEWHNPFDVVVIDPGHGGRDLGAPGTVSDEKTIVLSLALKLGEMIETQMPGVKVIYTRDDDHFVPLHKRAAIANDSLADLFISIHCNSNTDPQFFGSETYVMGIHKTEENLEVAKAENAAILMEENHAELYDGFDPESDEDYIMLNMFQSSSMEQSIRFSMFVQKHLKDTAGMYDRGVKQAGFVVLYLTTMPGVLVETGFVSNPAEEKYLLDPDNQDRIATAIFDAVRDYKAFHDESVWKETAGKSASGQRADQAGDTIYRVCFNSSEQLLPLGHRLFKGMDHLWVFSQNGKYYYTFGEFENRSSAEISIRKFEQSGKHQHKFNIKPFVVECSR